MDVKNEHCAEFLPDSCTNILHESHRTAFNFCCHFHTLSFSLGGGQKKKGENVTLSDAAALQQRNCTIAEVKHLSVNLQQGEQSSPR